MSQLKSDWQGIVTTTISHETLPRPESDRAESLRQLSPEVRSLVNAVNGRCSRLEATQSNWEFEQGFEFPWGFSPEAD